MKKIDFNKILKNFKIADKKLFYKDLLKMLSIVILLFIIVNLIIYLLLNFKIKISFENSAISKANLNETSVFSIKKIVQFSSAYATTNSTNLDIWNLNLSQFSDIAIYIDNNIENGLTDENLIKNLSINNIKFESNNTLVTKIINYKNINNFGKYEDIENSSNIEFNIIDYNSNINFENPEVYNSLQVPITLGYINKDIKKDYSLVSDNTVLNFNGSLLKRCKILTQDIATTISFDINITNNLNEKFICKVSIPILLENADNNSSIYDGYVFKTFEYEDKYNFYRLN